LRQLASAADAVRNNIRFFATKEQALLSLRDEIVNFRGHQAPEALKRSQERYKAAHLNSKQWEPFLLDYRGDVDGTLSGQLGDAKKNAVAWKGQSASVIDPNVALISDDADLKNTTLNLLEAEIGRLEKLIGADRVTADKFSALTKRINEETASLNNLKERLTDCQGAMERVKQLVHDREAAYVRVFEAVVAEEAILTELYSPLMERLKASSGTLKKLSFSVTREADVEEWAEAGEDLLDLRRQGSFKGRGTLRQYADADLKIAWETGDPSAVSKAMADFRKKYEKTILEGTTAKADPAVFREWAKLFAKWLYGTEHIKIRYGIEYDNLDIRKLSPGGRGIVLLLLYLALDDADDRPLIIDQPEENLDPKSIFDELVGLFVQAKSKRQVIMVTHNANLVVNTDADQVIVANVGPHVTGELPAISYTSGGLESAEIRKAVCDILEGGERAFQERARRLRVSLAR
jgi:DNA repair exonuclease SbcCD ATPase subunit